jgi:hypothetical protein
MARPKKEIHVDLEALAAARANGAPWKELERVTGLSRWTLARRLRNFSGAKPVLHHRDDGQCPTAVPIKPSVVIIKKF